MKNLTQNTNKKKKPSSLSRRKALKGLCRVGLVTSLGAVVAIIYGGQKKINSIKEYGNPQKLNSIKIYGDQLVIVDGWILSEKDLRQPNSN